MLTEKQVQFALRAGWDARKQRLTARLWESLDLARAVAGQYHTSFRFGTILRDAQEMGVSLEERASQLKALRSPAQREVKRIRRRLDQVEELVNPFHPSPMGGREISASAHLPSLAELVESRRVLFEDEEALISFARSEDYRAFKAHLLRTER